jgi:hypothetical protein
MARKKLSRAEKIRRFIAANPDTPLKEIAVAFGTTYQNAWAVKRSMTPVKVARKAKVKAEKQPPELTLSITMEEPQPDAINHPPHYKVGGIETIDFIEAKGLGYRLGNVVKYISRAEHKGKRLENLRKAQWYLNREIEQASQTT